MPVAQTLSTLEETSAGSEVIMMTGGLDGIVDLDAEPDTVMIEEPAPGDAPLRAAAVPGDMGDTEDTVEVVSPGAAHREPAA